MFYFVMACITMLVASTISFVSHNKSLRKDYEELGSMIFISFIGSILWFISIPVVIVIGGAWLLAKLFSKERKPKK